MNVSSNMLHCVGCAAGKSCKLPFSKSQSTYTSPLELVEMDLWGPAPVSSNGCLYYLSIIYVSTRYTWIHISCPLKFVQTNGGGELKALALYLSHHGIYHCSTFHYTSNAILV